MKLIEPLGYRRGAANVHNDYPINLKFKVECYGGIKGGPVLVFLM